MKLCVLKSTYEGSASDFSPYDTDPFVLEPHLQEHQWETCDVRKDSAVRQVEALAAGGADMFINLCDGASDEDRAGIEVVHALERLGVPFTGADSAFYEPSRISMKEACLRAGIPTPRFVMARGRDDVLRAARNIPFPMIVKHWNSYGSIGTSSKSRVETPEELMAQSEAMMETYGAALIEEFIEGREFSVFVVENADDHSSPFVYTPLEILFPEGETFNHFGLKWSDETKGIDFALSDDAELQEKLRGVCGRFFAELGGTGYGRCDVRLDGNGTPYVLEVNPNCGIFGPLEYPGPFSTDYIILNDKHGFPGFLDRVFRAAHRRVRKNS